MVKITVSAEGEQEGRRRRRRDPGAHARRICRLQGRVREELAEAAGVAASPIRTSRSPRRTEKKAEPPPQETPPAFARKAPAKPRATLTAEQLDELMEKHVGGIETAILVDDEAFLRRVTLDLIGRQPTMDEMNAFLADAAADKRAQRRREAARRTGIRRELGQLLERRDQLPHARRRS